MTFVRLGFAGAVALAILFFGVVPGVEIGKWAVLHVLSMMTMLSFLAVSVLRR